MTFAFRNYWKRSQFQGKQKKFSCPNLTGTVGLSKPSVTCSHFSESNSQHNKKPLVQKGKRIFLSKFYPSLCKGDAGIFGDPGENPPAESDSWAEFEDAQNGFRFKYQNHYKTVQDNYGWPHAVVHLLNKSGGQSYDVTYEIWESESDAQNEGRMEDTVPFFRMMEDPESGKFVSMTCWNTDVVEDCEEIYLTLTMQ